jgi:cytochrome c biogenesis protein CcmG, thiol:disulfide interchange protein DsbE
MGPLGCFQSFDSYYKNVRLSFINVLILFSLTLTSACNRGSRPAQTGKPAPDFTVSDGATSVHLAGYRGRVVLLNFWATWCAPCVAEMPSLLQLHRDNPDIAIIAVSVDEDADAYKQFLERRHIDLITVRDPGESAPKLFRSEQWPETYVIDRAGVIRRKFIGAQDWSSPEIRAYLKSL